MSHIFKQTTDTDLNKSVLIYVWSVSALVLTSTFSGTVLESIVNRHKTRIDTIEDLINAENITAAIRCKSWIWWHFDKERQYNIQLDNNMLAIKHLVKFINRTEMEDKVIYHKNFKIKISILKYRNFTKI